MGFKEGKVLLMPLGSTAGIRPGSLVFATGSPISVKVGPALLGRILNGIGEPIDKKGEIEYEEVYGIDNDPPDPFLRPRITKVLSTGVKSIDGLLTLGMGQRIGIFAGSGVGKSTLMGMLARNCVADVNVISLVGERGREVNDFIEESLGPEGLKKSVVVCATSDQPPVIRVKGALVGTAIAEYFRAQGKNVLLWLNEKLGWPQENHLLQKATRHLFLPCFQGLWNEQVHLLLAVLLVFIQYLLMVEIWMNPLQMPLGVF